MNEPTHIHMPTGQAVTAVRMEHYGTRKADVTQYSDPHTGKIADVNEKVYAGEYRVTFGKKVYPSDAPLVDELVPGPVFRWLYAPYVKEAEDVPTV